MKFSILLLELLYVASWSSVDFVNFDAKGISGRDRC